MEFHDNERGVSNVLAGILIAVLTTAVVGTGVYYIQEARYDTKEAQDNDVVVTTTKSEETTTTTTTKGETGDTEEVKISEIDVKNAVYEFDGFRVQLKNNSLSEIIERPKSGRVVDPETVEVEEDSGIEINEKGDRAAVVFVVNYGGTGFFRHLVVLEKDSSGIDQLAETEIGSNIVLKNVSFMTDKKIEVSMVTHGPEDPNCCPTQSATKIYLLEEDNLSEI